VVLQVSARGQWSSDIYLEQVDDDRRWRPLGDGGMHGDSWPSAGWSPSVDDGVLRIGQSQGTCVDDDGVEIDIVARAGFAGSDVRAVAVGIADAQRVVDLAPGLHAFVVIGPAVTWRLTPLGSTGRPIGDVEIIEAQ